MSDLPSVEAFPLMWSDDVGALVDWAVRTLGLVEAWRAPAGEAEGQTVEHAELWWQPLGSTGQNPARVSINVRTERFADTGPAGISLRVDDPAVVDGLYQRAVEAGAEIEQPPARSAVAYSFTVLDPDGNQWWVNAESGMLDQLRYPRS